METLFLQLSVTLKMGKRASKPVTCLTVESLMKIINRVASTQILQSCCSGTLKEPSFHVAILQARGLRRSLTDTC